MRNKVYAKQINPAYQGEGICGIDIFDYDEYYNDISVYGNGHFFDRKTETFEHIINVLNSSEVFYALEDAGKNNSVYKNKTEVIYDYLPPENGKRYSNIEIHNIVDCINKYNNCYRAVDCNNIICDMFTIVSHKKYNWRTIRGCCQDEWNEVFYPTDKYSIEDIRAFETYYFNTGTEWIILNDDTIPECAEDIDGYSMYCVTYDVKKEIAAIEGVNPEDVILYEYHEKMQPYYVAI